MRKNATLNARLPCFVLQPLALALWVGSAQAAAPDSTAGSASADAAAASTLAAADAAAEAGADDTATLETVTVTAVRKAADKVAEGGALGDRSALDTPFSLTTVDAEAIADRQASSLADVFADDAAVTRAGGTEFDLRAAYMSIRGLPLDATNGFKINGNFFYVSGVNLPLEDMDQVQLLKGSSGFIYGLGAPGGIVNYVTKKPTDQPTESFDVGYTEKSLWMEHADIGGRLGSDESFGYRLNASHQEGTTYTDSDMKRNAAALSLDQRLSSNLTWTMDALYQDSDVDRLPPYMKPYTTYSATRLPSKVLAPDQIRSSDNTFSNNRFSYVSTGLAWRLNENWVSSMTISRSALTNHYPMEYFYLLDQAGDYGVLTWDGYAEWKFDNAQALIQGSLLTGGIEHKIVAGVAWQNGTVKPSAVMLSTISFQAGFNLYDPSDASWTPASLSDQRDSLYTETEYRRTSAFASDTLTFSPQWSALLGVRYIKSEELTRDSADADRVKNENTPFTPTLALMYKPVPDATIYMSFVQALEQGTSVASTYANSGTTLPALKSKQYEVGVKVDRSIWGGSLAAFRLDQGAEYADSDNVYVQDGNLVYQGLDLSGRLRPLPTLALNASAVYLDSRYDKTGTAWLIDKQMDGTARFTGLLGLDWQVPMVAGLSLRTGARYTGTAVVTNNTTTDVTIKTPGYTVFNLGAQYETALGVHPLTLRAQVDNLLDKRYWAAGYQAFYSGQQRTLSLNVKFEM